MMMMIIIIQLQLECDRTWLSYHRTYTKYHKCFILTVQFDFIWNFFNLGW